MSLQFRTGCNLHLPVANLQNARVWCQNQAWLLTWLPWDLGCKDVVGACVNASNPFEPTMSLLTWWTCERFCCSWRKLNRTSMYDPQFFIVSNSMQALYITIFFVETFEVFNMLRNHDDAPLRGCRSLTLLGHPICRRGFMKALGLGKGRFRSLNAAARSGLDVCPLDRRYMPKGAGPQSAKRSMVYDFLYYLYQTCGEELPDKHHSSKRPRHGKFKQDPKNLDLGKMRHLPPASFADYFRLCQMEHPDANISLKLFKNAETPRYLHSDACSIVYTYQHLSFKNFPIHFSQVWMRDFGDLLRVRKTGHHARCSVCIRHRLIIRRLGPGPARTAQVGLYKAHLARQYKDRQQYWSHRSQSRIEAQSGAPIHHISLICDGMDQAKHAYPRSECMASKEFHSWSRPKMGATTIIAHGHAILVGLSPQNTTSSGSRTMELIAYMMTKPLSYIAWSNTFIHLEADNCSKEIKHQTSLRMLSAMVAQHKLRGAELDFLSSGHSHEDVDAHFSVTAAWLERHKELHCINDFQQCLENMLKNKAIRVHEPVREVVVFDRFHDWSPACTQCTNDFLWFPFVGVSVRGVSM